MNISIKTVRKLAEIAQEQTEPDLEMPTFIMLLDTVEEALEEDRESQTKHQGVRLSPS